MELRNAIIKSVMLGREDHGLMTFSIELSYGNVGQSFGGYQLRGKSYGIIERILDIVGVERWNDLVGKSVRVKSDYSKVHEIGNFLEDRWLNPEEYFEELGL